VNYHTILGFSKDSTLYRIFHLIMKSDKTIYVSSNSASVENKMSSTEISLNNWLWMLASIDFSLVKLSFSIYKTFN